VSGVYNRRKRSWMDRSIEWRMLQVGLTRSRVRSTYSMYGVQPIMTRCFRRKIDKVER